MPLLLFLLAALALHSQPLPRLVHAGYALSLDNGAVTVVQLRPNSPAARAGLLPGDQILNPPPNPRSLLRRPDKSELPLSIRRASQTLSLTLSFLAPPPESQPDFTIEYGQLTVDNHRRRTFKTIPNNKPNPPVILWLAGSGCASQESPATPSAEVQFLYALTRAGYATLRVEKTGVGDSEGPPCYSPEGDLQQEVRAYAAAVAQLRPAKIILFGHSAGATLAPLVLQQSGPVHAAILAGGMGSRFFDYILEMRRRELALANKPLQPDMEIHTRCLDALLNKGESPDDIEKAMPDCRRRVRFDSPPAYTSQWAQLDLARLWRALPRLPVLILYGTADFVTSLEQSKLLQSHIPQSRLQTLPMDHGFLDYATPQQAWDAEQGRAPHPPRLHPGLFTATLRFLKRN